MSSDVVTFIGLRLLAAVFAVPGRATGLLKIAEKKISIRCNAIEFTRRHCRDQLILMSEVVVMVDQLNKR